MPGINLVLGRPCIPVAIGGCKEICLYAKEFGVYLGWESIILKGPKDDLQTD